MNKWKYKLKIQDKNNGEILIESPIRLDATISFGVNGQSASGNFVLYNLSKSHRTQIRYNPTILAMNINTFIDVAAKIELYVASDGQSFIKVFEGAITEAYTMATGGRVGTTTHISANMIYTQLAMCSHIFAKGTSKREAIKAIIKDIPNVTLGNLGSIEGNFLTDTTCDGNAFEQIQKITGGNTFVDNGEVNVIPPNESIDAFIDKIHNDVALLGTPLVKEGYITFKCLFIPELKFLQYLDIDSKIYADFAGSYKVVGYTHTLVFSDTEGDTKTTDVHCLACSESAYQDVVTTLGTSKTDNNYQTLVTTGGNNKVKGEQVIALDAQTLGDIKNVLRYIQTHNGDIPNKTIVGNIKWADMIGHDNYSSERLRELDLEKLGNCVTIAQKLHRFLSVNNLGNATISSGWRSVRNNRVAGGETNSLHLKGRAIDFKLSGNNRSLYYTYFHGKWDGGYGLSPKWGHIHVDNGTRKNVYPN